MKNINKKGFTLIELLAVIVILGILMMMAIPAVTKYIENSRKDTFYQTAKSYIEAVRTPLLNDELLEFSYDAQGNPTTTLSSDSCLTPKVGSFIVINLKYIDLEKGKGKSSFNKTFPYNISGKISGSSGYVLVFNDGKYTTGTETNENLVYYFIGVDSGKNGIDTLTKEEDLKRTSVKKGKATLTGLNTINGLSKGQTGSSLASGEINLGTVQNPKKFYLQAFCGMSE